MTPAPFLPTSVWILLAVFGLIYGAINLAMLISAVRMQAKILSAPKGRNPP